MNKNKTIRERCTVNTNYEEDRFVGIQFNNGEVTVDFPLGYNIGSSDEELRADIRLLISTIGSTVKNTESVLIDASKNNNDVDQPPISAYLYLIQDFMSRGYYKETEILYKTESSGKVNWARTIKKQQAFIQDDEVYYLKFNVRKNTNNYNELITLIHKYCVFESYDKIGWLFSSFHAEAPLIKYDYKLFRDVIISKISNTFNDRNKELFINMLAIIEHRGDKNAPTKYTFGTNRFEYVWEQLIDRVYGIANKEAFFPSTEWHIKGLTPYDSSKLEPDTIMIFNNDIYILDAKYYKYGFTFNPRDLPASSSINKQITYGEYVDKLRSDSNQTYRIYNAFIMPFNSATMKNSSCVINIGEAVSRWKSNSKTYEKIQGILVDTKHLMKIVTHQNAEEIEKMAKCINSDIFR